MYPIMQPVVSLEPISGHRLSPFFSILWDQETSYTIFCSSFHAYLFIELDIYVGR